MLGFRWAVPILFAGALHGAASCSAKGGEPGAPGGGAAGDDGGGGASGGGTGGASATGGDAGLFQDVTLQDTGGDGTIDPDAACLSIPSEAKFVPATILFVVDKSGSMNCNPPPEQATADCVSSPTNPTNPTKWELTRNALEAAIQAMPSTSSVGIAYFPKGTVCEKPITADVPIAALTAGQRSKVAQSLGAVNAVGATPLVGSLLNGYIYLDGEALDGNVFVILITDGAESCNGDAATLIAEVADQAANKQVRTFVIGSPGSEGYRSVLSDIAFSGGTSTAPGCDHGGSQPDVGDCHFDMTTASDFGQSLNQTLEQISGEALSCELPIPSETPDGKKVDHDLVNVRYSPGSGDPDEIIKKDESKPCDQGANGWQYNADKSMIILCGDACTTIKSDPTAKVDILFGCKSDLR